MKVKNTNRLSGLKMILCQMPVVPGRPDLNADYMVKEILSAINKGADVIIFPEMCVAGYLIGDLLEDEYFVKDILLFNEQIREATKSGITAIFGSITVAQGRIGEDGRRRKFNTALIAKDGQWLGSVVKSLHPNYRIFGDDRHFYSARKIAEEFAEMEKMPSRRFLISEYLKPCLLDTKAGVIKAGIILCEDMWHKDYAINPVKSLVENGAEIIFNLSASPWSWQKNRKRHEVVRDLIAECRVPFVYVNNTGVQNTGKNIVVFDGSSTVYSPEGEIVFTIPPYEKGSVYFEFAGNMPILDLGEQNDSEELYKALHCGLSEFLKSFPPSKRKVFVGLSGGVDSALSLALFVDVLGPENVFAVNMPSRFNSQETKNIAKGIADNLGVRYEIRPIQEIVDKIAEASGVPCESLAYENIQARVRMEILAARSQDAGGVFSANWNKVEAAFGYGTLYGDMAGFAAPLGDLVKREVYQIADYVNQFVFGRKVIPQDCFNVKPSAELRDNQQDPFDYGNLDRRGYHDEMVRAFMEFRFNPEWFLWHYAKGTLEKELMLEQGTLKKLFKAPLDFIKDLEKNWRQFHASYFKRVQSAPIPIVSRRAFGTDLRESMVSAHFTQRYRDLKRVVLARNATQKSVAIYGGSFNPPGKHHRQIVKKLTQHFDLTVIVPCGTRPDKSSANILEAKHRSELVQLGFSGLQKIQLDLFDLEKDIFTPAYQLQERYEKLFPNMGIWHVVGGDIIAGGRNMNSEIHRIWHKGDSIWQNFNFAAIDCPGCAVEKNDLPPSSKIIKIDNLFGRGTFIREYIAQGKPVDEFVDSEVLKYIQENDLYLN